MPRTIAGDSRNRARILGITKSTGGVAAYNRVLSEALRDRGYDVRGVCLSEGSESYARTLSERGIPAVAMAMERYDIAPLSDASLAMRLTRRLRRDPVDLLIAHTAKGGFLSRLAGRLTGTPVLYVMHSMPFLRRVQGRHAFLYRQLERFGSLLGGHIVVINHAMRDELVRRRVAPRSRVTVIHSGIDPTRFARPADRSAARRALGLDAHRPVIGWAGRLNPQKAPLDFVRAVARLAPSLPEAQFFMAGEGPLAPEVRAEAERLRLGDRLIHAPWQDDVATMYAAFDVYCATSHWEGLPLSLLEAMAAERAAVVTAVDGVREVIRHEVDGVLVDPGDTEATARHLERLIRDERRRGELAHAARARVLEHFTLERMMERWEIVVERQLGAGGTR